MMYIPFDPEYMKLDNLADENKDDKKSDYVPINFAYAPVIGFDSPELIGQLVAQNPEVADELESIVRAENINAMQSSQSNIDNYGSLGLDYLKRHYAVIYFEEYVEEFLKGKGDFTQRVPLKFLHIEPETRMGGVLGYTYLGENFMVRRADLTGETARMVDIHESIHTPDEYETRVITRWIMEEPKHQYHENKR